MMYPSYSQPGMYGGPGYPMMPPQPNLMMGMPQQGNNEGLNNVFNAQADAMKTMNRSLKVPYVARLDINEGDNDDSDCDEEKNDKDFLKLNDSDIIPKINTQSNPFKYLFGVSADNWHKYYDFNENKNNIYKDFVLLNNASYPDNMERKVDMELLRRVVKQGPIIAAKTWLTRSTIVFTIILIIMLILSVSNAAQISGIAFIAVGGISAVFILGCLYDCQFNSKGRGINRWSNIKREIKELASINITVEDLFIKIDNAHKPKEPFIIQRSNPPAQPTQQSGGLLQGALNVAQFFNK